MPISAHELSSWQFRLALVRDIILEGEGYLKLRPQDGEDIPLPSANQTGLSLSISHIGRWKGREFCILYSTENKVEVKC
jgi:hypothetical protein